MKTKIIKTMLLLGALASAVASAPVFARDGHGPRFRGHAARHHSHFNRHHFHGHSHTRFGLFIGAPLVLSPWYAAPRYYYPPAVVVPPSPPVYIERQQAAAEDQYWYYCRESGTYYPYVKECAGPWQKVAPHSPPS